MFYVLTKRVVRLTQGKNNNQISWDSSGPFETRVRAEEAAVAALTTDTCLAAQVFSMEQIKAILAKGPKTGLDPSFDIELRQIVKFAE